MEAGVEFCEPESFDYDVLLVDTDHPQSPPVPEKHLLLREAYRRGITIGLYPHGGMAMLDYDGMRRPFPLSFELVHGEGHKRIYEAMGLKRRIEVVGWSYCDRAPNVFQQQRTDELGRKIFERPLAAIGDLATASSAACGDVVANPLLVQQHLVFAPIHPWADGKSILPINKALNEVAYRAFLEHPAPRKTVRMYGADEPNGVFERQNGVDYTQSDLTLGVDLIDSADAVISYGTFACTALARGKPVAMIYPYPAHTSDDGRIQAVKFSEYAEMCRYPASVGDAPLEDLFQRDTSEWEKLFVGGPLNIEQVLSVLSQYKRNRAQRRKAA